MATEPLETAEGSDYPCCRQLSVFAENRLGQLLRLTRLLDGESIRIRALEVSASFDCAIVRLLVDDPDTAVEMLTNARFAVSESEVLVVELPAGSRGIMSVCAVLIAGEININAVYPLLNASESGACLAIQVDSIGTAAEVLKAKRFHVLDQSEL